jgi:hypothetical protein
MGGSTILMSKPRRSHLRASRGSYRRIVKLIRM